MSQIVDLDELFGVETRVGAGEAKASMSSSLGTPTRVAPVSPAPTIPCYHCLYCRTPFANLGAKLDHEDRVHAWQEAAVLKDVRDVQRIVRQEMKRLESER